MQPLHKQKRVNKYDVVIVGAGAAGLIAAARAAELGAKVLVLEKMHRAGIKLLITGKGRCNITNTASIAESIQYIHPNGRFLKHAFSQFFSKEIIHLLKECGVETTEERGGRIFPVSNEASDVLNALLSKAKKHQVEFLYDAKVEKLIIQNEEVTGVEISRANQKKQIAAANVILCTGGKSYPATGSTGDGYILAELIGHSIEPVRPALVPLVTEGKMAESLQGLSLKNVKAMVWMNGKKQKEEFGEMLFTHFGLSGPIILTLSRFVVDELLKRNNIEITIDLKPALDEQKLDARLLRDLNEHGKKNMDNIFKLWLPAKLIPVFLEEARIYPEKKGHQLTTDERRKIKMLMKELRFKVTGYRSFKEAIITAGGIRTEEIDPKTMQSKIVKNLYFAGEIIDLDADTGGFNLQIAFSTAWLAAQSCVGK